MFLQKVYGLAILKQLYGYTKIEQIGKYIIGDKNQDSHYWGENLKIRIEEFDVLA